MLTKELLKANNGLQGLTDEQLNIIETLSKNDEDRVIGARIGEVYRQEDETIKNLTGIDRNGDEKTYMYRERVLKGLNEKANQVDTLTAQVGELSKEKARLEKVIAEGGSDGETKKALSQKEKDLIAITKQFTDLKAEYDAAKAKSDAEILGIRIENELSNATQNLHFKKDLPEAVTRVVKEQVIAKVKAMNPEFEEDGNGTKRLIFKDSNGATMRNQENLMNPYTASELIAAELKAMGVLDEGRKQNGGGTAAPTATKTTNGGYTVDVTGAKTRVEAYDIIANGLMSQGLTNGSAAFDAAMKEAWQSNNVSALPER